MNRLLFEKTGDAVWLSHLDLMRVFQRAFKRADIMIWHTQGFSPRAYVSIALPLSVGVESGCEILDFEIQDGSVDLQRLPELLNRTLPVGIRVLRAYESAVKIRHLVRLRAQITLEYDAGVPQTAQQHLLHGCGVVLPQLPPHLKPAISRAIGLAIAKHHHAANHVAARRMGNIIGFDARGHRFHSQ